ncbi:MAG: hypothetical protein DDT19_01562 [Syntrophomonadaceae bacterium]|nr:hypothetical protein [Bacillota bacterium]
MKYRKHIRLKNYDYKTNGYYFVTVVTKNRLPLLCSGGRKSTIWQWNCCERIIRNEKALLKIREHIQNNPEKKCMTGMNWISKLWHARGVQLQKRLYV